jgi:hypothetical protein
MTYNIQDAINILSRTPEILNVMLKGLPAELISANEGEDSWSAYDIVGHLIHGEKTDWIPRAQIILSDRPDKSFEPFDRFAQFEESKGKSLDDILKEFKLLRESNLLQLAEINSSDLNKTGIHPAFGEVSLSQLLSTWVVHDLNHLSQIARVLAHQYKEEVGPWTAYLGILKNPK